MLEILRHFVVAAECYALFFYFGFPLARLLRGDARDPYGSGSALTGMSLVVSIAWTWIYVTDYGLRGILYAMALGNVVPFILAIRRSRPAFPDLLSGVLASVALASGSLLVFWHYYADVIRHRDLIASMGNADLPVYALMAQHLVDNGFDDKGFITGADLGFYAMTDYFGAFVIPTVPAVLGFVEPARSLMPLLLLAMFLTVASLAGVLERLGGLSRPIAASLALLACSSSLYFYSMGQGFFAQLVAMALFVKLIDVAIGTVASKSTFATVRLGAQASVYFMGLVCIYQHMAFLILPVLLGVAALATFLLRDSLRGVVVLAALAPVSLGLGCLLIEARASIALHKTFSAGTATAGWTLPRASLSQVFGVQLYPNAPGVVPKVPDHAAALSAVSLRSVAIVMIATGVVLLLVRTILPLLHDAQRRIAAWSVSMLVVPLASYYAFYGYFGPSYQQWKWLSFFQPVIAVGTSTFICVFLTHHMSARSIRLAGPWLWVALLSALTLSVQVTPHETRLTSATEDLRHDRAVFPASGVNVNMSTKDTFWDTMWTAYFISKREVVLQSPSYFPTAVSDGRFPTVRRTLELPTTVEPPQAPPP